ncbi:MAG: endo alpha-1,4 polygalactosaminidase [Phycisphaerae bacterium]|nr:endo alpha-1,4 polygalactosaminidase [Phycisphaerae bacterium]
MRRNSTLQNLFIRPDVLVLVLANAMVGCPSYTPVADSTPSDSTGTTTGTQVTLKGVRFWAYQLQGIEEEGAVAALVAARYDLLVLEPTRTDRDNADFDTRGMVQRLHSSPASRAGEFKLVVAYLDIGEAEDWRYYWQASWVAPTETQRGSPDLLICPDPDGWSGNYPVAYWDERWKNIIIYNADSMLQKALDDGFDGIYMDWVEAYSDEAVADAAQAAGVDSVEAMVEFISEIRDYARQQDPDFLIIPQNASELAELHDDYLGLIDAIGQEQIYFDGDADTIWADADSGDVRVPAAGEGYSTQFYEETLAPYLAAGKVVLCVDYAQQPDYVAEAYQRAAANGYIPYVSLRSLSRLTETPPPGYPGD